MRARSSLSLLLSLSLFCSMGAHWIVLQSFAWTKMAFEKQRSPCGMCLTVERGTQSQQRQAAVNPDALRVPLMAAKQGPRLAVPRRTFTLFVFEEKALSFLNSPATPPPRRLLQG